MRYQIAHNTIYRYTLPVILQPHLIRLTPRNDGAQVLRSHRISILPEPIGRSWITDLDGNTTLKVWFSQNNPTENLTIEVLSKIDTLRENPFEFLLDSWVLSLPFDYPTSLRQQLQPYLSHTFDPLVFQMAQELCHNTHDQPIDFLMRLNQTIYQECTYLIRETGDPWPAGLTWSKRSGSCRDLTVLFMEVCRMVGLAARFVSGYEEGDPTTGEWHLHAWAEVYLPGAGWRGFDPTQGRMVGDRHVTLNASALPTYTIPIGGAFDRRRGAQDQMTYQVTIQAIHDSGDS